jgi:ACS family allantoate permease-like MFS transporter
MPMPDEKAAMPDVETTDNHSQAVDGKLDVPEDVDKAAGFLLNAEGYGELTSKAEKRLKRKIDWFMVPMVSLTICCLDHASNWIQLFLVATLGAVDKVALGTSALYGLSTDNHLIGQQYSWLGSILSLGAIVGMPLSSYLIQRLPSAKYLCGCSIGWSAMSLLLPA